MELALNLAVAPSNPLLCSITMDNNPDPLRFCMALSAARDDPPLQLDLLPNTPVLQGLDVNTPVPTTDEADVDGALSSSPSPNSAASSLQLDFFKSDGGGGDRDRAGSDEDDNAASTRKKLRLTKEQSAFLEESFKQHTTLNPKQKLALAKELNLRPRQVEVWFQNRRARTKLKQTEVDCEYLKRCCETLTEENRRLHKELQELRALKSSSNPFYMQLPATTLTMCPSCERVATSGSTAPPTTATGLYLATQPPNKKSPGPSN